jgi:hypothetical protein
MPPVDYETYNLDSFKGLTLPYYGACGNAFKVGTYVLEAMEDESDGYRSSLECVRVVPPGEAASLTFSASPVGVVKIEGLEENDGFSGHVFRDALIDFEWGRVGTNRHDDYYPSFNVTFNALDITRDYELYNGRIIGGTNYPAHRDAFLEELGLWTSMETKKTLARYRKEPLENSYTDDPRHGSW